MKNYYNYNQTMKKATLKENLIDLERVKQDLEEAIKTALPQEQFLNLIHDYREIIDNVSSTYIIEYPDVLNGIK